MNSSNVILLSILLGLIPIIIVLTTSFIKISMVLIMARESIGVQQIPPNILIYSLSLILSFYVMGDAYTKMHNLVTLELASPTIEAASIVSDITKINEPLREFLNKHSPPQQKVFFNNELRRLWTPEQYKTVKNTDFIILIPAFVVSEISQAFKIGFTLYLPSIIIDIIISNILMALGMMMMSPATISLPIKLLLFISIDGWTNLIHLLFKTY